MLSSCTGDINFTDPVNTRKSHEELMTQVRTEAIHVSNKYKVKIDPLHFKWDRFIALLEREFPDIWNEMLNSQWQPLTPNKNRPIPHRDREKPNGFGREISNRIGTLTTPSQTMTYPNMTSRFHHSLHSMPEMFSTCNDNSHFTNHFCQATQNRGQAPHMALFRMMNISHEQQGFYLRGSPRSKSSLYGTFQQEYYNQTLHNLITTTDHLETVPFAQARSTSY